MDLRMKPKLWTSTIPLQVRANGFGSVHEEAGDNRSGKSPTTQGFDDCNGQEQ